MPRKLRLAGAAVLFGATLAWAMPASAFSILAMLVHATPGASTGDFASFDFLSPSTQEDWPMMARQGVGVDDLLPALIDPARGIAAVGIDFPAVDAILRYGEPPDTVLYLYGAAIAPAAVRPALLARPGMTEAQLSSFAIFAVGEDFAVNPAARENGYPFGGGWLAHRVAVRPGWAAVSFASPQLASAVAAIEAQDAGVVPTSPVVAMIRAAASVVPDDFMAYAASGLPAEAFGTDAGRGPDYMIVVASAGTESDWEATQFLVLYATPEAAEAAALSLAASLEDLREWPEGAKVQAGAVTVPGGAAAMVTVLFPPGAPDHPSSALLNRWRSDIVSRRLELPQAP